MNKTDKNIIIVTLKNDVCSKIDKLIISLKSNYNILKATTVKHYETRLKENEIDCVLVCSTLQNNSLVVSFLKHINDAPHILITDEAHKKEAQDLINSGVKDYIISDRPSRLMPAIKREIEAFNDRKESKKILEELKLSKEAASFHLENTPIATISWDLNFNVTLWNKAATNIFGYTAKEAIGKNCLELTVPKGFENKAKAIFKDLILQKGTTDNINETLTKSGKIIICHWHNTILENSKGETIGIISSVEDITEKENMRKASVKSKRLLESAQKLSEVHFIEISLNTNKVALDKHFLELSGYPRKNCYESSFFVNKLIYPLDKMKLLRAIKEAINNKSKLGVDVRVVYADGTIRWINILADILSHDKKGEKSLVGTFIDITERKQELFELEKQKQKLNLTIEIANLGFLELDFESNIIEVSGKTKEVFELDKNKNIFDIKDILSRVHPEDKYKVEKALKESREKHLPYQINHRLALPSGSIIWVNNIAQIIFDKTGKPIRMLGIFRDVTNQVNRERRLLQHSLILNQISSLVMVLDKNADFIFVSPSIYELTGYSISEVLGQGWWNVSYVSEEEKVKSKNNFISILEGKTKKINDLRYERKVVCKNGDVKWFSWQFSRGTDSTIIGSAQDITKEKEKEFLVTKLFTPSKY